MAGHRARAWGNKFEQMIEWAGKRDRITIIKIPDGCKTKRGQNGKPIITRIKTPFDFVAMANGMAIVFDAKTTDNDVFPRSMITPHQLDALERCSANAKQSGLLIWYRAADVVAFHPAKQLRNLQRGQSLKSTNGQIIGRGGSISFAALFHWRLDLDESHHPTDQ